MRILVTGAGGFIGSHLCAALKAQGHYVIAVDKEWRTSLQDYANEYETRDLRSFDNCWYCVRDCDRVYHLAADMGGMGYLTYNGARVMRDNQLMNLNMLEATATIAKKGCRFMFASSACVYPEHLQMTEDAPALKEDDAYPANPDLYYGWEKLITEKECEAYARDTGLDIRIARFHNVYGPGCDHSLEREKAPAALCKKAIAAADGGELAVWGDGRQTRSFLYIDDCVAGIIKLVESNYDKPLNVGSDERVTIDELAELVIAASGKKLTINHIDGPQGVRGRNSDNTRSSKILNWSYTTSLATGITKTYEWYRGH